jgi:hypothetical protein
MRSRSWSISPTGTSRTSRQAACVRLAQFDVRVAREQAEYRLQGAALLAVVGARAASGVDDVLQARSALSRSCRQVIWPIPAMRSQPEYPRDRRAHGDVVEPTRSTVGQRSGPRRPGRTGSVAPTYSARACSNIARRSHGELASRDPGRRPAARLTPVIADDVRRTCRLWRKGRARVESTSSAA